jgi:hypothetical protein
LVEQSRLTELKKAKQRERGWSGRTLIMRLHLALAYLKTLSSLRLLTKLFMNSWTQSLFFRWWVLIKLPFLSVCPSYVQMWSSEVAIRSAAKPWRKGRARWWPNIVIPKIWSWFPVMCHWILQGERDRIFPFPGGKCWVDLGLSSSSIARGAKPEIRRWTRPLLILIRFET